MISVSNWLGGVAAVVLCLAAGGCLPSTSSPLDEQREPHFLTGKSRVNGMDYQGAIAAFEKALEVNPRSASAHLELGLLYENNELDFAAAVYHFDRYLKLRPNSENAEIIKQRMLACKQELARSISLAPVAQTMQRDLERLADENRDLRQKLEAWQAYYTANAARLVASVPPTNTISKTIPTVTTAQTNRPAQSQQNSSTAPSRPSKPAAVIGTHTVKAGETPAVIARKYGVKLEALMAANPGLNARHLKIGQTITVPAP